MVAKLSFEYASDLWGIDDICQKFSWSSYDLSNLVTSGI